MQNGKLEARVAALEDEVARLKKTLQGERDATKPGWEQIAGSFAQDRLYKEAMELGRRYRRSERPLSLPGDSRPFFSKTLR